MKKALPLTLHHLLLNIWFIDTGLRKSKISCLSFGKAALLSML